MMFYCNGSSDQAFFKTSVPFYSVGNGWGTPFTCQEPDAFSPEYYMQMWGVPYRRQTMPEALQDAWMEYVMRCTRIMMGMY